MSAGVYLHIPFCKSRCSYCDFATDVYRDAGSVERYVDALVSDIGRGENPGDIEGLPNSKFEPAAGRRSLNIDTVYFGGGTPSLLAPGQIEKVIAAVGSRFDISPDAEITMEMNPATVTSEALAGYRELGVNRASFGVQTFKDRDLKLLARGHDANDARETYRLLRKSGFDNISFDLIAGLPGQTIDDWSQNLDEAVAMAPDHLSLYLLEIHESTPLAEQLRSGRRPLPDEELAAEMYEMMIDRLAEAGYDQYEISNFARPGSESRHNMKYWRLDPVYGFGVSAHSFDGKERYANERDTAKYVQMMETGSSAEVYREQTDLAAEHAFLGLRLTEGIDIAAYRSEFGSLPDEKILELTELGLLERSAVNLRMTRKGMVYSNEVFQIFV